MSVEFEKVYLNSKYRKHFWLSMENVQYGHCQSLANLSWAAQSNQNLNFVRFEQLNMGDCYHLVVYSMYNHILWLSPQHP